MKKFYNIEVDCAICAAYMEEAAEKVEGVKSVVVNFMMLRMVV
ncbi:MAG: cation transporter, partial [Clostridia bacterium]|nr:cation transporter [Clostridia bacterium]